MADIAPFGKNVPEDVQAKVEEIKKSLVAGELEIFKGPIYDNKGELRVAEGETIALEDLLSMNWLVKGVNGSIPE